MVESKSRSFCCVPGCFCGARRQPYLSFHSFPTDPDIRGQWVQAIRRPEGPHFSIRKGSTYVCSRHFATEDFICGAATNRLKNGVVPSLFSWNNFTAPPQRESASEGAHNKHQLIPSQQDSSSKAKAAKMDHDYVALSTTGALDEALQYIKDLEAKLEKVALPSQTLFSRYCASDDQIWFYTRFPSESVFRTFWETIAPSASRLVYWSRARRLAGEACSKTSPPCDIPLIDEFLMYSFRVAAGMKEQLIADMFSVSIATVSRVTITWANYLYIVLASLKMWINREMVKSTMPLKFKKYCPNVRVVLDCAAIALETASSLTLQSKTFSSYKNRTVLKGLIGVAPCGLVTFISPLYTGCLSDEEITRISGILPLLEPGDEVMADTGFLIEDLLAEVGAKKLTIPPFRHPGQFSQKETKETKAFAHLRRVVERAIDRVKCFHIWDKPVPPTLIGTVNQIWHNCCVLSNYQGPFCLKE